MTLKKLLTGIALLLALMWLSGELLLKSDERALARERAEAPATTTTATTTGAAAPATPTAKKTPPVPARTATTTPALAEATKMDTRSTPLPGDMISVTLSVEGKTFTLELPKGASVATLLAAAQSAGELTYVGKDYSGLGMLIIGVNGKLNNQDKNDLYWIYSVNGQKAQKGVSEYVLAAGDTVSWSYEQNTY